MRSPVNMVADWICRRSHKTEDTLITAVTAMMVSIFLTIAAVGGGMEVVPVLFG